MKRQSIFIISLVALFLGLPGCGGGGSGGGGATPAAPTAPAVSLDYGVKQVQFSWAAVSGATHYKLFENPDGVSGYTQVGGDIVTTSVFHNIALYRRLNARYIIEACNSIGCTGSTPQSLAANLVPAIGYVKASNTGADDHFGYALAVSADGNTLAVGADGEASSATGINGNQALNNYPQAGAVYVFVRNTSGIWSQQAYIKASNTRVAGDEWFGRALVLSADGNTLAVGAVGEDSAATGINGNQADISAGASGAVYVYTRSGSVWTQQAYVKASNTGAYDNFGSALALSANGNTMAVGAYGERSNATGINGNQVDNTLNYAGAAYIFTRSGSVWTQQAYVKASNTGSYDWFGSALALSAEGNTLAVGAYGEGSNATGANGNQANNSASGAGAVYVFTRSGTTWAQQTYVKASNTGASDAFGNSVALSADGSTLAVGAYGEDSNTSGINGNQVDDSLQSAGAVYVFSRSGSIWTQQAYVKASNTGAYDWFGRALALSADGNTLAVGADGEHSAATGINGNQADTSASASGAVYVYTRSGSAWSQQAYVKASNTGGSDRFGHTLALSTEGNTLAVGAYGEASSATGISGNQTDNSLTSAGALYLY